MFDLIDELLETGISIMEKEIAEIERSQPLDKENSSKLIEYVKTLVLMRRDLRLAEKEDVVKTHKLSPEELDAAIDAEIARIAKGKSENIKT